MRNHWATRTIAAIGAAVCALTGAWASEPNQGQWTMQPSERPGMLQFSLHSSRGAHGFTTISDWPTKDFSGLDLAQDTQFTLTRDAGKFEFDGTLRDSAGAGSFEFVPDARYPQEMQALGFDIAEGNQIHLAVHDVSLSFARDMKNANLQGLDADKLLAFRIHGLSRKFIDDLQAAGLNERDSDQLIAFRIHGVTPEMVQRVRSAGYTPDSQSLVNMRIHGATPKYMDELKQVGYDHVPMDQLIAFRIHGVTPDFIGEVQKLGFQHPRPDELVNMRIHGVTPEYITELQLRGVKNLTIDKLVALKIHGID
jgi:phosphoglycolate phosphatase-like HAD superfamily hydrolase